MPGFVVKLLDENGVEVEGGEIAVPAIRQLSSRCRATRKEDRSVMPIQGKYYRTGDLALRGLDGLLSFVGRADDAFKSSDYCVSPFEIESALIEREAMDEAAVVPSSDPQRMVVPKAFILLAAGYPPDPRTTFEIFSRMSGPLGPYERALLRVESCELPKTISGKLRRAERRNRKRRREEVRGEAEFWEPALSVARCEAAE